MLSDALDPAYLIDGQGKRLGIWRCPLPAGEAAVPRELLLERLLVQDFIAMPATAIRRDAFLHVGALDQLGTARFGPDPSCSSGRSITIQSRWPVFAFTEIP